MFLCVLHYVEPLPHLKWQDMNSQNALHRSVQDSLGDLFRISGCELWLKLSMLSLEAQRHHLDLSQTSGDISKSNRPRLMPFFYFKQSEAVHT